MFSAITQPNFPKAALGVEDRSLTALELQSQGRGQLEIKQAASVDLPPGLVLPSFLDRNIPDPQGFVDALREAVMSAGLLSQKRWSVALPSNTARTAILALESEPASRQEMEEILDWKAEQSFGAPAAELRLSKYKIAPDKDGRSRYFATAVKLSVIDEYETHFEGLGWKAGLILPRAVGEANWLMKSAQNSDSLLLSSNSDGFTALLLRGTEPAVVRSVSCTAGEIDDEIYRLLMFYNDRFAPERNNSLLERLLVVGNEFVPAKVQKIASEALGRALRILTPDEVGLYLPDGGLSFNEIAAPAGLAALAFS